MLPLLHRQGLVGDTRLHSYHCDCEHCDVYHGFPIRAQRDSSCAGELITKPFETIEDALEVIEAIQDASLEADAVPGLQAGLHVHVDARHLRDTERNDMLWQWLRWEPTMCHIAAGAFGEMRGFNPTLRHRLSWSIRNIGNCPHDEIDRCLAWHESSVNEYATFEDVKDSLYCELMDSDRHTSLAVTTRFNTFEFRLWNSTRSAWRMEMYCRLSQLWMEPTFHELLATVERSRMRSDNTTAFLQVLDVMDESRTAELVERQIAYSTERAGMPDPVFASL